MPFFKEAKNGEKALEIRQRLAFCDSKKERKEGEDDAAQMDALNGPPSKEFFVICRLERHGECDIQFRLRLCDCFDLKFRCRRFVISCPSAEDPFVR